MQQLVKCLPRMVSALIMCSLLTYSPIQTLSIEGEEFKPKPILVSELFRHGARTNVNSGHYKVSAPFIGQLEKIGLGNLTGNGGHMHLLLGMQLNKEYPHLFDPNDAEFRMYQSPEFRKYSKPKVNNFQYKLYSSSVHRCIVSAQSHLLGLYPPDAQTGDYLTHSEHDFVYKPIFDNLTVSFKNETSTSALPLGQRIFPLENLSPSEDRFFFADLKKACNLPYNVSKKSNQFSRSITEKYLKKGGTINRLVVAGFDPQNYIGRLVGSKQEWNLITISDFYDSMR